MNITKQITPNECGVCVLTSLYETLYKKQIDKISILNNANIQERGLSLHDFERLANSLGINTEVYELEWIEFLNFRSNNFLVIPIQIDGGLHYVIARKFRKFITIYDSRYEKPFNQTYDEFQKCFAKLMITVNIFKQSFKFPINNKIDLFKNIKISFLLISIFIQISIIVLSTVAANYLNLIINNAIANETFKNGLIITLVFLLINILNSLTKYVFKSFCARSFKQCFMCLSNNFIDSLNMKKKDFINKVDRNNFYLIDSSIQSISNFITYEISIFCSNICLSITTLVVISSVNPYFLITSLFSIIVIVIIGFIQYNFKNKILTTAIYNQNINNNICQEYIKYFESQYNFIIQDKLNDDLKKNYSQYIKLYLKKTRFDTNNSLINELFYNLIYFLIILISTFLIINNKNMNIGQLTFLVAISSMSHNSIEGLCEFVIKKVEFKTMSNIYESFVRTSNDEINNKIVIEKIDSLVLKINDSFVEIENGQYLDKNLVYEELIDPKELLINNISAKNINLIEFRKKFFILNIFSCIKTEWLLEKLNNDKNEIIIEGIKLFKLNLSSSIKYSLRDQTLLNVLYSCYLDNRLIILEDNLLGLTKQELSWIHNVLIPYVKQKNFVLFSQTK